MFLIYYLGFIDNYGHGWLSHDYPYSMKRDLQEKLFPWEGYIDGKFCIDSKETYQPEGRCLMRKIHHANKIWTLCTFWDRSSDKRHGSNSAFLIDKEVCFNEIIELARKYFPKQIKRVENKFPLKLETWV